MQGPVERDATSYHADIDVIPHRRQAHTEIGSGEREISSNVRDLVSAGKLRVNYRIGVHYVRMAQGAAERLTKTSVPRGVNIVGRRVERSVAVAFEHAKYETVLGVHHVIKL